MADNSLRTPGSGESVATDELTYSGDTAKVQLIRQVHVTGSEGSKSLVEVIGTAGSAAAGVHTIQGVASMTPVQVGDNSGSLTVDAPVGTPVFVRLSDGSAAITTLPVSLASVPSHAVTNAGTFAVQVDGAALTALQLIDNLATNPSTTHLITAASTNATNIKSSAGTLLSVHIYNNADYPIHVKFHNNAGTPTAGTGVVFTASCQAGTHRDLVIPKGGRSFATGIAITVVTGIADSDNTAVAANDASIEVCYE